MATVLKQVLEKFEDPKQAGSMSQIARELELDMNTLQSMVDYWVRKGKLREVINCDASSKGCSCGGGQTDCPYVMTMPRGYERVSTISLDEIQ